jgi:thioredoxin-related protein
VGPAVGPVLTPPHPTRRNLTGMERLVIAIVIVAAISAIALVVRSRRTVDAPTQRRFAVPQQLDRADFARPDAPWLVAVFSSETCDVCRSVVDKARVLESTDVAVVDVEYVASRALHERYSIEAVPTVVVADANGVNRAGFIGPMSATDLWAAVAEARQPGSTPEPGLGQPTT